MSMSPSASTVASASLGVPIAIIVSWIVKQCYHVDVPGEVQAAGGALISTLIGYVFNGGRNIDTVKGAELAAQQDA